MSGATNQRDHAVSAYQSLVALGQENEWEVVVADDDHLQIDYDVPDMPQVQFDQVLNLLEQRLGKKVDHYRVSRSRSGNIHVIIALPQYHSMNIFERVGWQPCSDQTHYERVYTTLTS